MFYSKVLTSELLDTKHRQPLETVSGHSKQKLTRRHIGDRDHSLPTSASSTTLMAVSCTPWIPCRYPDHFDLRVIVMTHKRTDCLLKILKSLDDLELDGAHAVLEIWMDRAEDGSVHNNTLAAARQFRWSRGPSRVHVWDKHVGIMGQWIDSWRPNGTSELAMILEDDLTISPYAYRWLRAAHNSYGRRKDVAGYTFQAEAVNIATSLKPLTAPADHPAFLYQMLGTWGYAPHPERWREFQDWFHQITNRTAYKPYVPGTVMTKWYAYFERKHREHTFWEMWHIHYCYLKTLYSVYTNLKGFAPDGQFCLAINRKEPGLHFRKKVEAVNMTCLVVYWNDEYIKFPDPPLVLGFDGQQA